MKFPILEQAGSVETNHTECVPTETASPQRPVKDCYLFTFITLPKIMTYTYTRSMLSNKPHPKYEYNYVPSKNSPHFPSRDSRSKRTNYNVYNCSRVPSTHTNCGALGNTPYYSLLFRHGVVLVKK